MTHVAPAPDVYYSLSRQRKRFFTAHQFFRFISQLDHEKPLLLSASYRLYHPDLATTHHHH